MKGTIRYLSPESISLKHLTAPPSTTYTQSTDIWSLGLTIFELLCRWRFSFPFITSPAHRSILSQENWEKIHGGDEDAKGVFELLKMMLAWDPEERIDAREAKQWVERYGFVPGATKTMAGMRNKLGSPTMEPKSELGKRRRSVR